MINFFYLNLITIFFEYILHKNVGFMYRGKIKNGKFLI